MLKQAEAFAPYFQVINLDRPGYGTNSQPPDLAEEHFYWLEYINRKLNREPVHIIGISQGARIALRMAANQPAKVASLALHGAAVDGVKAPIQQQAIPLERYVELVNSDQLEVMKQEWLSHPMMREGLTSEQQHEVAQIVADYSAEDLKNPQGHNFAISSALYVSLKLYEEPVLVTTGSLEAIERQYHAHWLRDNLQNSQFRSLDGAGHLANFSHAATYNAILLQFYVDAGVLNLHPDL
jgi:pimeloyl-ACP methyl ester carboxylesterase